MSLGLVKTDLIGVSVPGGGHFKYYKCTLGGSLKPICDFVHDYVDAVSDTDDRLMVVYPKV